MIMFSEPKYQCVIISKMLFLQKEYNNLLQPDALQIYYFSHACTLSYLVNHGVVLIQLNIL